MMTTFKEVTAFIRPDKWPDTREAADALGAQELVHWRVLGRGQQRGLRYLRPLSGGEEGGMQFLPKRMASWVIESGQAEALAAAIIRVNCTNNYGDGKVFVSPVDEVSGLNGVGLES